MLAKNKAQILECYYRLDDYDSLEGMVDYLDDHDPLLMRLAKIFTIEGMYKPAIKTYLKVSKCLFCSIFLIFFVL